MLIHQLDEFAHFLYVEYVARIRSRSRTHAGLPESNNLDRACRSCRGKCVRDTLRCSRRGDQDANTQSSSCFGTSERTSCPVRVTNMSSSILTPPHPGT